MKYERRKSVMLKAHTHDELSLWRFRFKVSDYRPVDVAPFDVDVNVERDQVLVGGQAVVNGPALTARVMAQCRIAVVKQCT